SRIGAADRKVCTMDGTRYIEYSNGGFLMSFNAFPFQDEGGNFMSIGPTVKHAGDPHTLGSSNPDSRELWIDAMRRFAFRHDDALVVSFWDGHVEELKREASRNVHYWFPSRSVVTGET